MLRRSLLALLLSLFAAGFVFAAQGCSAGMQVDQACMQPDASGGDCGGDGMASSACSVHCALGACVVSAIALPQLSVPALRPFAHEVVPTPECPHAPDTAPPKALLS
jgi:hypothetical protein